MKKFQFSSSQSIIRAKHTPEEKAELPSEKSKKSVSVESFVSGLRKHQTVSPNLLDSLQAIGVSSPLLVNSLESLRLKRLLEWLESEYQADWTKVTASSLTSEKSLSNIALALNSPSLFCPLSIVCISGAEEIKAPIAKKLVERLNNFQSSASLLIIAANTSKPKAGLKHLLGIVQSKVEISPLNEENLRRWAAKEIKRISPTQKFSRAALDVLCKDYQGDLTSLAQSLESISLLSDQDETIGPEVVSTVLSSTPERSSFDLVSALTRNNLAASLSLVDDLLAQGLHPLQLVAFLSRSFRILVALSISGAPEQDLPDELNHPWFNKKLRPLARNFQIHRAIRVIEELAALDLALKSSKTNDTSSLKSFVIKAAAA